MKNLLKSISFKELFEIAFLESEFSIFFLYILYILFIEIFYQ